jgi:hypothetical protein
MRESRPGRLLAALPWAALAASGCLPAGSGEEPVFDVCRKQLSEYVTQVLRQHPTQVQMRYVYEQRDLLRFDFTTALVFVEECPGYHYFDVRATADTCEMIPHYGRQPTYIRYLGSFDGC